MDNGIAEDAAKIAKRLAEKKKKEIEITEWEGVIEGHLLPGLRKLMSHIAKDQRHEGWEKEVVDIQRAFTLWYNFKQVDDWDEEKKAWDEFMNYLRDNMRSWWC